jgi:predicted acylesterase/phospholipase RssA
MFDGVVFAGGGTRCFWQLGFWSRGARELGLAPTRAAAVSAGSAIACAALLGRCEETLASFQRAVAANRRNAYPRNLLGAEPVFPHAAMYRRAILELVGGAQLAELQARTELRIVVGRPPAGLGAVAGLLLGLGCYLVSRRRGDPVHPELAHRLGFEAEAVSVRSCRTPDELADLILASSCTPPFTPVLAYRGRPAIDGSVVDAAPVFALDGEPRRTLVLLTRRYLSSPPALPDRVYVGPSEPIPIRKWDYTSPELLARTYALGQRDAEAFLRRL